MWRQITVAKKKKKGCVRFPAPATTLTSFPLKNGWGASRSTRIRNLHVSLSPRTEAPPSVMCTKNFFYHLNWWLNIRTNSSPHMILWVVHGSSTLSLGLQGDACGICLQCLWYPPLKKLFESNLYNKRHSLKSCSFSSGTSAPPLLIMSNYSLSLTVQSQGQWTGQLHDSHSSHFCYRKSQSSPAHVPPQHRVHGIGRQASKRRSQQILSVSIINSNQ